MRSAHELAAELRLNGSVSCVACCQAALSVSGHCSGARQRVRREPRLIRGISINLREALGSDLVIPLEGCSLLHAAVKGAGRLSRAMSEHTANRFEITGVVFQDQVASEVAEQVGMHSEARLFADGVRNLPAH